MKLAIVGLLISVPVVLFVWANRALQTVYRHFLTGEAIPIEVLSSLNELSWLSLVTCGTLFLLAIFVSNLILSKK
jgi:hypothetical protein